MDREKAVEEKAREIRSWIENAVYDLTLTGNPYHDDNYQLRESEADQFFNDPYALQDLCGDKIYDASSEICRSNPDPKDPSHNEVFIAICEEMKRFGHQPLLDALDMLILGRRS